MNAHVKQKSLARFSAAIILVVVLCVVRGCKTASDNDYHRPIVSTVESGPARKYEGIGTVTLKGPKTAEVLSYQTWIIVYTAGKKGIKPGGGLRAALRHMNHLWSTVQNEDPKSAGYLSAKASNDIPISVSV